MIAAKKSSRVLWPALDSPHRSGNFSAVPTLSKPASRTAAAQRRKALTKLLGTKPPKPAPGPSFGEWACRVAGMVKGAPRDLSTRECFGD